MLFRTMSLTYNVNGSVSTATTTENSANSSGLTTHGKISESAAPPAIQFAFGVVGNAIALLLLYWSRARHRWRPFYRMVFCLAITDFCGILLVYPLVMLRYASNFEFEFSKELCRYYISLIFTYAPMSSVFLICAMSIDRFLAILCPLSYRGRAKYKRANIMLLVQFLLAVLISGLHLFGLGDAHSFYPKSWCFFNFVGTDSLNRANSFIYATVGITTVFVTMILNTVVIATICRRTRCNFRFENRLSAGDRNNLKIIVFLITIVVVFAGLWLPLMVNFIHNILIL